MESRQTQMGKTINLCCVCPNHLQAYLLWPCINYDIHFPTTAIQNTNISVLTTADQRRLLNYLQANFSFRNLGLLICLYSGLRIGEVCALQRKDLDVATGEIHNKKTV